MVNAAATRKCGDALDSGVDVERALALSYAPAAARAGVAALLALDDALGRILRRAHEPMIAQMRLTWWHDALERIDDTPPPAEPVLRALAADVLPRGVTGKRLAAMIDAWEALLDPDTPDAAVLDAYAARGTILFGAAGKLLGAMPRDPIAPAGRGWALADLARHVGDVGVAAQARELAEGLLNAATAARWTRPARSLGALAHLARMDLAVPFGAPIRPASPSRVWRMLRHRMTGR